MNSYVRVQKIETLMMAIRIFSLEYNVGDMKQNKGGLRDVVVCNFNCWGFIIRLIYRLETQEEQQ